MIDPEPLAPLTDAFFDRIVDGGLTPTQLRQAIDRLEREPDGWKRCALAFLQAQAWQESLRSVGCGSPDQWGLREPTSRQAGTSPGARRMGWNRIALAAGLATVGFGLGWLTHRPPNPSGEPGPFPPIHSVAQTSMTSADTRSSDIADTPNAQGGSDGRWPPGPGPVPMVMTVGRLRLGPSENAPSVPILAGPGIDEQWLRDQPPPITEHEQALLQQQGFQVNRQRHLISARLADGRRVAVPVDRVEVRYNGIDPL